MSSRHKTITISLRKNGGDKTRFNVSKKDTLETVKRSYTDILWEQGVTFDPDCYTYTANGIHIQDTDKILKLNIKEGDVIEATSRSSPGPSNTPRKSSASVHSNDPGLFTTDEENLGMSSSESSDSARQKKVLQKSDKILRKISQFLSESCDESGSLEEECRKFLDSSKFECDDLTDCVNDDLASDKVKEVGKSVLKVRKDVLEHFEQTAKRMKGREENDKARNSRIQEAFERKKIQFEELDKKHTQVLKENEGLTEELGVVLAELNSIRSESKVDVSSLEKDLEESNKSLDNVTADLTRATKALSSLSKDRIKLEEEVQNLKPLQILNENLAKEAESLQRDVKALKEDQALQREKERVFSSLKNHMAKKLEEKEVVIEEKNGQLKAMKNELSQEKQKAQSTEEDIITLDAPFDKKNRILEQRISEQRKKLVRCTRQEERLKAEVKQHTTNLAMINCGVNQLVNDPTTPSSVIRSLMLLKHSLAFSLADTGEGPQEKKKIKLELEVKEEYQEYFEHADVKQDAPPACETEQGGPKDLEVSGAQMGASVTEVGDVAILQEERTEPDGPKIIESDGMQEQEREVEEDMELFNRIAEATGESLESVYQMPEAERSELAKVLKLHQEEQKVMAKGSDEHMD